MNQHLQTILNFIQQDENLTAEEKATLTKGLKDVDKELTIADFKLERTEKVKRTTAILLEETIEELEQKRKAIEETNSALNKSLEEIKAIQAQLEHKNRDLEIETSLERVRAMAMGMKKPDELLDVCEILLTELRQLGFADTRLAQVFIFNDAKESFLNYQFSDYGVKGITEINYNSHPVIKNLTVQMREAKEAFMEVEFRGNQLEEWKNWRKNVGQLSDPKLDAADLIYYYWYSTGAGAIGISTFKEITEEQMKILDRFRNVFSLAYRRYTDIAQAELQAREAQIELGLERVRARAMAMQNSDELSELVETVFKELTKLDFALTWCIINIIDEPSLTNTVWAANPDIGKAPESYHMKFEDYPFHHAMMKGWKERKTIFVYVLEGLEKKVYDEYLFNETEFRKVPEAAQAASRAIKKYVVSFSFSNFGGLQMVGEVPLSDMNLDILSRFGKVFDLTYTRFNDLKQAEAQVREAKIEAALERIRSRTMAMHKSDELAETATVLFEQFKDLGELPERIAIGIVHEDERVIEIWATLHGGNIMDLMFKFSIDEPHVMKKMYVAWKEKKKTITIDLRGKELDEYFEFLKDAGAPVKREVFGERRVQNVAFFSKGMLTIITPGERPRETIQLLERFAAVFEQTYIRFLDLQKAETQTRESQIELGLERVRARAMAMQNSDELNELIGTVFNELTKLDLVLTRSVIMIFDPATLDVRWWMANSEAPTQPMNYLVKHRESLFTLSYLQGWKERSVKWQYQLQGTIKKELDDYVFTQTELSRLPDFVIAGMKALESVWLSSSFNNFGCLSLASLEPLPDEHFNIMLRFAKVFDLTYTRFNDLKQAEAQAKEAIKRSSVDRVRAEIASMRTTNDLEKITPVVWNELITLGVPFIRCGIFIMDEQQQQVQTFLSTPDGKAITSFTSPFSDIGIIIEALPYWRRKEIFKTHWDEAAFLAQAKSLVAQGAISSSDDYLTENHPTSLYLHFLPFLQGMLYVGNDRALSDDELQLVQTLADAFSIAYARYEDFNKLEAAKQQVENTLVDLKQAQQQLVQSEKMASLGELTAGIAHEIQNPLNFVNNFSEVSNELLDEMKTELTTGNGQEAIAIADDVKQNLQKILHHGKRAEAIVKGMLQHSRSSSGTKEPTDINALADEYLRLSYHGLRSKNNSFNATLQTNFDATTGKINVIPQDIGRVLLNLYNNAFYAASLPPKGGVANPQIKHEPTVWVSTKKMGDTILISVRDNGPGIPEKILDKIFQPFFTTKPTGQGTGLGLSLSYDIIKAHGGELKVNTREGEGAEFTIILPI
jgi:signal transduction histidine kinase